MMEEYFGIRLGLAPKANLEESSSPSLSSHEIVLTGLPILLQEHSPSPHGVPLFLLRLATEVDWTEERPCFDGVCRDLGNYYSQLPSSHGENGTSRNAHVQHIIVSSDAPRKIARGHQAFDSSVNLYKVFERC
jgi:DNA mismatch repair protein MLH1